MQTTREGDLLVLRAIDSGIGIAEADLPHVFDRFYRADRARVSVAGTGLGLSLTKTLIEQLGGTVACASTSGRGTIATLHLHSP